MNNGSTKRAQELSETLKLQLESKFASKSFSTTLQVAEYVESRIVTQGFSVAFPTVVLQDTKLSNLTPLNHQQLIRFDLCTVDFGIKDCEGLIVDTARTYYASTHESYVTSYRAKMRKIETQLKQILRIRPLKVKDVSRVVERNLLELSWKPYIVNCCGAHTILPHQLHGTFIPMQTSLLKEMVEEAETVLKQGTRFTVQPHVIIRPSDEVKVRIFKTKATIVKDVYNNLDSITKRLRNLKGPVNYTYQGLQSNGLSFYQEQTYLVDGKNLRKMS